MKQKYFYITTFYNKKAPVATRHSGHIVRANSKEDAERITKQHGIPHPSHSENVTRRHYLELNKISSLHQKWIKQSSVWYEDENGELQRET